MASRSENTSKYLISFYSNNKHSYDLGQTIKRVTVCFLEKKVKNDKVSKNFLLFQEDKPFIRKTENF